MRPYHQHRLLGWWRCVTRTAGKARHHIILFVFCLFGASEGSCACKRRKDPMQSSSDGRWEGRGPFHVPSAARRRVAPPVASPHLPGSVAHVTTRLPVCRSAQCCCGAVGVVRTRGPGSAKPDSRAVALWLRCGVRHAGWRWPKAWQRPTRSTRYPIRT